MEENVTKLVDRKLRSKVGIEELANCRKPGFFNNSRTPKNREVRGEREISFICMPY